MLCVLNSNWSVKAIRTKRKSFKSFKTAYTVLWITRIWDSTWKHSWGMYTRCKRFTAIDDNAHKFRSVKKIHWWKKPNWWYGNCINFNPFNSARHQFIEKQFHSHHERNKFEWLKMDKMLYPIKKNVLSEFPWSDVTFAFKRKLSVKRIYLRGRFNFYVCRHF